MNYIAECLFPSVIHLVETELNQNIKSFCLQEHKRDPVGVDLSNIGGWQSKSIEKNSVVTEFLYNLFNQTVHNTFSKKLAITNYWVNINQPNTHNRIHRHPHSVLSGVYYVQVPEDSGNIIFENQHGFYAFDELTSFNPEAGDYYAQHLATSYIPKEGLCIMFPSYLAHGVATNNSKENRISISFNTRVIK